MKYVMFDMDGVLLDSERGAFNRFRESLLEIGIREDLEELLKKYVGIPTRKIAEEILERHKSMVSVDQFLALHHGRGSYYEMCSDLKPMEGLVDFLEFLKEKGIPMAVVSSTSSRNVLITLDRLNILKYFGAVVCGDAVKQGKPSPEPYLKAAEYLQAAPDECLVIEDSKSGVESAVRAGMYVIAYKKASPEQNTELASGKVFEYRELKELLIKEKLL